MSTLAECYIHFAPHNADARLAKYQRYFVAVGKKSAKKIYGPRVLCTVTVSEGSIKAWVKVGGALYAFLATYGTFRQGIDYLANDARKFSGIVAASARQDLKLQKSEIIRIEHRLGIPGKIQRLVKEHALLMKMSHNSEDYNRLKSEFTRHLSGVTREIDEPQDIELLIRTFHEGLPDLSAITDNVISVGQGLGTIGCHNAQGRLLHSTKQQQIQIRLKNG